MGECQSKQDTENWISTEAVDLAGCELEKSALFDNLLDPTHLPIVQPDLDAMGVKGRLCQDVFDHAAGQFSGALIFFQYDVNLDAGSDVATIRSFHPHLTFPHGILLFLCALLCTGSLR